MDKSKRNRNIAIGIVIAVIVVLVVCAFVPMSYWDDKISSGCYISEAVVADINKASTDQTMTVQLYSESKPTNTTLLLQGDIPDKAHVGQQVDIGYSKEGLYEDTSQSVQVSYYVDGNVLMGFVVHGILQLRPAANSLKIADLHSDGTALTYYVAS